MKVDINNHSNSKPGLCLKEDGLASPEQIEALKASALEIQESNTSDDQEKSRKALVEALESQLGLKAPQSMDSSQKIQWLRAELEQRDVKEQLDVLQKLDTKLVGSQSMKETRESFNEEVLDSLSQKIETDPQKFESAFGMLETINKISLPNNKKPSDVLLGLNKKENDKVGKVEA